MSIKQKKFVSAVVYVRNAEKEIENFLKMLHGVLSVNFEKFEIICANDASTDNSKKIIQELADSFDSGILSIVNMGYYQGVEAAMHAGVDFAVGDFVFEFDSTVMDYDSDLIMQVYNRSLQGFDIVSCGKDQKMSSKLFYSIYNLYAHSGAQHKLKSETFRVLSRRAINRIHSMSVTIPYRKALYSNCGLKMDYIYYTGDSKRCGTLKDKYDTAVTALILFTGIAYKVALLFTFAMMLVTLGTAGYVAAVYILGNPVAGYTTMMLFMSMAFFMLFAILSIVIKYLSVILEIVFNNRRYVIESIEKVK
ncbi:MAG: glycosyltransferase [Endomicrobia bacterium]|nr:glycosyltransferase [Endomicrobiia bacterium]